jgi:chemotaxis protein MotB
VFQSQQGDSELGKIAHSVSQAMAELIEMGVINVRRRDNWVEIEIKNSILFKSGSAKLKTSVIPVLKDLASLLARFPNTIKIEGYTDSDKIATDRYPSNWELSAARAASIVRVFELANMLPERMSVVGYGETRPVADNSTAEGKAENRRVVIMIMANNDVARTVHDDVKTVPPALPSEVQLEDAGLVDTPDASGTNDEAQDPSGATAGGTIKPPKTEDDNPAHLQQPLPAPPASVSRTDGNQGIIVNPLISPPIRLFSPIDLPFPLNRPEDEAPTRSQP